MLRSESMRLWAPLAMTLFIAGCQSEPTSADANIASLEPTLDNIQEHIFDRACSMRGCHISGSPAAGLDLSSADAAYETLVNTPVTNSVASQNAWLRVKPGDPDLSFLVRKVGIPGLGEGAPMPYDFKLHPYYQDLIKDWISAGALR